MHMDWLHVVLAALTGGGWCLAWGYRTALHIAMERDRKPPSDLPPAHEEAAYPFGRKVA